MEGGREDAGEANPSCRKSKKKIKKKKKKEEKRRGKEDKSDCCVFASK